MTRTAYLLAALALLLAATLRLQGCDRERRAAWEADAARVTAAARLERARADSANARAAAAEVRADSAMAAADALRSRRIAVRVRVDTMHVPVEAQPYTAPRDTLIALLSAEADTLRAVVAAQDTAIAQLRTANGHLRAALDSTVAVLERRPRTRWWVPEVRVGYGGVLSVAEGRMYHGPAVVVGWKITL